MNIKKCDVHGVSRNVSDVRIRIEVVHPGSTEWVFLKQGVWRADMGPRAQTRLLRSVEQCVHPPGWKPEPIEDDEPAVEESEPLDAHAEKA